MEHAKTSSILEEIIKLQNLCVVQEGARDRNTQVGQQGLPSVASPTDEAWSEIYSAVISTQNGLGKRTRYFCGSRKVKEKKEAEENC